MKQGLLFCICLKHKGKLIGGVGDQKKLMPIKRAHALLGHDNEAVTRKTGKGPEGRGLTLTRPGWHMAVGEATGVK